MSSVHEIVSGLKARRSGTGWIARCPAHADKTPSLSITERDGKVLVHCHAGCAQTDVIAALRDLRLWHERSVRSSGRVRFEPDPDFAADYDRAYRWRHAVLLMSDEFFLKASVDDPDRRSITALVQAIRNTTDGLLVYEYRRMRDRNPRVAAALVHAGRNSLHRIERKLAFFITGGMRCVEQPKTTAA
jgi:hypothetical protein